MSKSKISLDTLGVVLLQTIPALLLFFMHGWDKVSQAFGYVFSGNEWGFVGFVASLGFPLAGFFAVLVALLESFGALMVAAGIFTRQVALLLVGNFVVASYFHITTDGKFELAAVYLILFLFFTLHGPAKVTLFNLIPSNAKK